MSFSGDISLDADGNAIIKDGQIATTTNSMEFIVRNLKYGRNAFKTHPSIGFGLEQYVGQINDPSLHRRIIDETIDYFFGYGIAIEMNIIPVETTSIAAEIIVPSEGLHIVFVFDLESGIITFAEDQSMNEEEPEEVITQTITNKYINRR